MRKIYKALGNGTTPSVKCLFVQSKQQRIEAERDHGAVVAEQFAGDKNLAMVDQFVVQARPHTVSAPRPDADA